MRAGAHADHLQPKGFRHRIGRRAFADPRRQADFIADSDEAALDDMLPGSCPDHHVIQSAPRPHPHTMGEWNANNCLYVGPGNLAADADPRLRLTTPGGPLRLWDVPPWLAETRLSYHGRAERWHASGQLEIVSRGQEFVANIGDREGPRRWLDDLVAVIEE